MILSVCGTWWIEWGPGSPRPDYFMLYRCGDHVEYVGTFLALDAAITEARSRESQSIVWRRHESGSRRDFYMLHCR